MATAEAQTIDPRVADLVRDGKLRIGLFLPQYGKGPDGLKTTVFVETGCAYALRIGIPLVIVEHATPPEAIAWPQGGFLRPVVLGCACVELQKHHHIIPELGFARWAAATLWTPFQILPLGPFPRTHGLFAGKPFQLPMVMTGLPTD